MREKSETMEVLKHSRKFLKYLKVSIIFIPLLLIAGSLEPFLIRYLLDDLIPQKALGKLFWFVMAFFAIKFSERALSLVVNYSFMRGTAIATVDEQKNALMKILKLPMLKLKNENSNELFTKISSDIPIMVQSLSGVIVGILSNAIFLAIVAGILIFFSWQLSLIVFSTAFLYVFAVNAFNKKLKETSSNERQINERLTGEMKEDIEGMISVKKVLKEDYLLSKFKKALTDWLKIVNKYSFVKKSATELVYFVRGISPIIVLCVGGYLVMKKSITLGTLVGFYAYMGWIYEPIRKISEFSISLKSAVPVYERVRHFEKMDEEKDGEQPFERFKDARYENVRFTYTGKEVLKGVNLRLYRGQSIAIVGLSGSGKSTLVSLLPRYYQATAGKVLINSNNVKEYLLRELRKKIVVVHQNDFLFNTTVKENITLGEQFTEEQFQEAVRIACVDRFIGELDRGYETIVGERGSKLSDGQRQRVAIARAVIRKPEVLVLDEATSGVDSETEEKIFEGLKSLGITVVIVSHRLSTIRKAEKILVLDDGRIVEEGSHDELAEKGSMYRKIIKSQLVG